MTNNKVVISKKIEKENRENYNLYIDKVYYADPTKKDVSAEVLSKLLAVKNQGGVRFIGSRQNPKMVILFTSGEDEYWHDYIDTSNGIMVYYGDNKTPGTKLHETKIGGNEILKNIFNLAASQNIEERKKIPPVFVFKKESGWNVKYIGLVVPGVDGKPNKDWLTAVWGCNKTGDRFQNYKAYFTIIDTSSGCDKYREDASINLAWLNDIEKGNAFYSSFAPIEWKRYIQNKKYRKFSSVKEKFVRTKEEQLPSNGNEIEMLNNLQQFFINKDRGYSFETFAIDLTKMLDKSVESIEITRPFKDGGIDGNGKYRIFSNMERSVLVDFYLQAKCYAINNAVTTKDTARLISRIKNKEFGILFTTSYVANQAYSEILEDGHPIIMITGKNIIDFLVNELEINNVKQLKDWLVNKYGDNER